MSTYKYIGQELENLFSKIENALMVAEERETRLKTELLEARLKEKIRVMNLGFLGRIFDDGAESLWHLSLGLSFVENDVKRIRLLYRGISTVYPSEVLLTVSDISLIAQYARKNN